MGELRKHYFQGFLSKKFHLEHDEEKANQLTGLIYMISGVLAPLIGMLLDKARHNLENRMVQVSLNNLFMFTLQVGRNISMVLVAVFLTSSSFFLLTFTSLTPYLGMGMMGVAYSILVSALWPIAALMVTVTL